MNIQSAGVGAIILAAGASVRMGEPKQLLQFQGSSLVRRAVDAALASRCEPVVVVLGANAQRILPEIQALPVIVVHNERWSEGMGTSVRAGLEALEASAQVLEAAVLMVCDQPHLDSQVLNALIDAHHASEKSIVSSQYDGAWGVPMLFARTLWPELLALGGSRGAQSIAHRHAEEVVCVPFALGAHDVDTHGDYTQLLSTELNRQTIL